MSLTCVGNAQITDAANEAKDNVKYLATLEKSLEPMYMGTPHTIQESLPTLINNIKMMHTIARYYNTSERMTVLFQKVTNQMVRKCKEHVLLPGKLWDQDKVALLENLTAAVHLNEAYQEQYRLKRDKLQVSLFANLTSTTLTPTLPWNISYKAICTPSFMSTESTCTLQRRY